MHACMQLCATQTHQEIAHTFPFRIVMSAAAATRSEGVDATATPTRAAANAGASLMPSPTIARPFVAAGVTHERERERVTNNDRVTESDRHCAWVSRDE